MALTESIPSEHIDAPATDTVAAPSEWRRNWPLVLAGTMGISITGLAPYSLGLFMEPLGEAFGWTRGFISAGLTIIAVFGIVLTPFVGSLIDRFGPRAVAIPGIILSSMAFAALGLNTGTASVWLMLWGFYAVSFVTVKPLVWSAAVSRTFDKGRGLALAVTLSGVALSQTLTPLLAEWLIRTQGWREAFLWLGLGWGAASLLIVVPFFREYGVAGGAARTRAAQGSIRDALNRNIAKIAASSFLLAAIGAGIAVHKVPILGEFGVDRGAAAALAATAGISGIVGKLATGWLMDRFHAQASGAFGAAVTGVGILLLLPAGHSHALLVTSMLVLGFGAGASLQIAIYLASRFADAASFGRALGIVSALMAVGAGVGPGLFGIASTALGGYGHVLMASVPVCALSGLLIAWLDRIPDRAGPSTHI